MMTYMVLMALAVTAVCGAPMLEVAQPQEEPSLLRVKRTAETIIYGNHQNTARVKKAGPLPPLAPVSEEETEAELDKKASVSSQVEPAEDKSSSSPDVATELSAPKLEVEAKPSVQDVIHQMVAPPVPVADASDDEGSGIAQLESEEEKPEVGDAEEFGALQGLHTAEVQPEDSLESEEIQQPSDYDLSKYGPQYEYPAYDYYYPPFQGRRKRSAPKEHRSAVQAEDMGIEAETNNRIKRDLPDDYADYEYPLEDDYEDDGASEQENEIANAYLDALLQRPTQEITYPEQVELLEEPYGYDADMAAALAEEEEDEEEEKRTRMALLEYLYAREAEREEQEALDRQAQESAEEAYERQIRKRADYEPEFEEIIHNNQPGIFFPVKRQYLSLVPGNRKRSFYPASYGPDGRWGALVQPDVEKRNEEEMYERLYQLAQALRGDGYEDGYARK